MSRKEIEGTQALRKLLKELEVIGEFDFQVAHHDVRIYNK